MLKKIFNQPAIPFSTTQPVHHIIKKGHLQKLLSTRPFSTLIFMKPKLRKIFTKILVNERIVEVPFIFQNLPQKSNNIMDIGCCESTLSISMASLGHKVLGVDIRPFELTHPNFKFIMNDICQINLSSKKFDIVTCLSALEHIGLDTIYGESPSDKTSDKKVISIIHKSLTKGGKLLLTVPATKTPYQDNFMRAYTPEQLKKLLKKFSKVNITYLKADKNRQNWLKTEKSKLGKYPDFAVALINAIK